MRAIPPLLIGSLSFAPRRIMGGTGLLQGDLRCSCDGKELAPSAKKVPAIKTSGDRPKDRPRNTQRDSFVRIIDQLSKIPECIVPLCGVLLSEELLVADGGKRFEWTGDYKHLQTIPAC